MESLWYSSQATKSLPIIKRHCLNSGPQIQPHFSITNNGLRIVVTFTSCLWYPQAYHNIHANSLKPNQPVLKLLKGTAYLNMHFYTKKLLLSKMLNYKNYSLRFFKYK